MSSSGNHHQHQHHQHHQHQNADGAKYNNNNNDFDSQPITFLTATAKIQKLGLKQRSARRVQQTSMRSSFTAGHQGAKMAPLLRSKTVPTASTEFSLSQSERLPLVTPEQRELHYSSPPSTTNNNNVGDSCESPTLADLPPQQSVVMVEITTREALMDIVFGKYISLLLLVTPVTLWANYAGTWSPASIFWLNFCVMVPLASILGDFTEEMALHTNQTIGGLINATFGNAVEVVVAIQALAANEIRVVQASMLGSIFSNLLLVLGCCFFFGGLYHKEQKFNSAAATSNMGLLALSSIALVLPTPFAEYYNLQDEHVLTVSRVSAIFLMFMYLQLLFFQLHTHVHIFEDTPNEKSTRNYNNSNNSTNSKDAASEDEDDEEDDEEEASISMSVATVGLLISTLLVAYFSQFLVDSIDGYCESSGVSRTFVGLIILPIVGNAVEHITAVTVAMKDKMDLAMGVAIGSCTQISLFVVPLTVLVGWAQDKPMTLNFPHFEIILYVLSVITVSIVINYPKVNWLEGSLLITTYAMIAVGFWYEKVVDFR